jgi:hypothetical protein
MHWSNISLQNVDRGGMPRVGIEKSFIEMDHKIQSIKSNTNKNIF